MNIKPTINTNIPYAIVLEGGGAKGAFQIGAYKAIHELGIEINAAAGTSIGSMNAALILQNDFEKTLSLWNEISFDRVLGIDDKRIAEISEMNINLENITYFGKKIKDVLLNRGFSIKKTKKIFEEYIDEDALRKSGKDFGIMKFSLSTMKQKSVFLDEIPEGELANTLMASGYYPVFRFDRIDGEYYIDGGIYDNVPINLIASRGYKNIIVLRTSIGRGFGVKRYVKNKNLNIIEIRPKKRLTTAMNFDKKEAKKNIKRGYLAALQMIADVSGERYCISNADSNAIFKKLSNSSNNLVNEMAILLGYDTTLPKYRLLFQYLLPEIARFFGVENTIDYSDILLRLFEEVARIKKISNLELYSFDEFIHLVATKKPPRNLSDLLPEFIEDNPFVKRFYKRKTLLDLVKLFAKALT